MIRLDYRLGIMAIATTIAAPTVAAAQEAVTGSVTYSVVVRHLDRHPRSRAAARTTLARIGDAAMTACGGSSFSLREVRASIEASPCWRDGMADALARIGDPMLAATYDHDRPHHR